MPLTCLKNGRSGSPLGSFSISSTSSSLRSTNTGSPPLGSGMMIAGILVLIWPSVTLRSSPGRTVFWDLSYSARTVHFTWPCTTRVTRLRSSAGWFASRRTATLQSRSRRESGRRHAQRGVQRSVKRSRLAVRSTPGREMAGGSLPSHERLCAEADQQNIVVLHHVVLALLAEQVLCEWGRSRFVGEASQSDMAAPSPASQIARSDPLWAVERKSITRSASLEASPQCQPSCRAEHHSLPPIQRIVL